MRFLGFADQLVGLFLRHLAAAHHVLHEVARALDREAGEAGGGADHVLHGGGDLAARFLADQLGALGHLGDRVAHVGATMSRSTTGAGAAGCRGRFLGLLILVHHVPGPFPCSGEGLPVSLKAALRRANFAAPMPRGPVYGGKYMIFQQLRKV